MLHYSLTDASILGMTHDLNVSAYLGWGDALKASASARAIANLDCKVDSQSFTSGPITPLHTERTGQAVYGSSVVNPGDEGYCHTTWSVTLSNPGYLPVSGSFGFLEMRCDNRFANRRAGCVVADFPEAVQYRAIDYPDLASHVQRAQESGLPGATHEAPLTRGTDAIRDENRRLACGDVPSVQGKSCDEYPLASSQQGLTAGGERRTFDGCSLNFPRQTGPNGVSVCMIPEGQNQAQGGIMNNFYADNRVLEYDPFRVVVDPN